MPNLTIGSPAPPILVDDWLCGEPLPADHRGIVVVEFWVTWCGPCLAAMPLLDRLQERFAADGVRIVGITPRDVRNTRAAVDAWLAQNAAERRFALAFDTERTTYRPFSRGAGRSGFPATFVLDRERRLAWIGHPSGLEGVLEAMVAGTHDLEVARLRHELPSRLVAAAKAGDWTDYLQVVERLIEVAPLEADYRARRIKGLMHREPCVDLAPTIRADVAALWSSPDLLASYVDMMVIKPLERGDLLLLRELLLPAVAAGPMRELLRVLDRLGMGREVAALAQRGLDRHGGDAAAMLGFLDALLQLDDPAVVAMVAPVARRLVERAADVAGDTLRSMHYRFRVLARVVGDHAAALPIGARIVDRLAAAGDADGLNEFVWAFMNQPKTRGRYLALGARGADLLERLAPDDLAILDTVAFVRFECGEVDRAIAMQRQLVADPRAAASEYREHLEAYVAAHDGLDAKRDERGHG